jgi:ligand-binding SRPBCC domain-containing protein
MDYGPTQLIDSRERYSMAVFETSLVLNVPPERVFEFSIQPANIVRLSPPELGLKFVDAPEHFSLGSKYEFKVQAWGTVQTSFFEVVEFDHPLSFVEVQLKGPMKSWRHEHRFEVNTDGQTVVFNRIEFAPPGGLVGLLVTEAKLLDNMDDGFYHRHQQLRKLLEGTA